MIVVRVFYLLLSLLFKLTLGANPKVSTPLGVIEGTLEHTYSGSPYYQFEGIPYAVPPIGTLRFENPQDPQKWDDILKANVKTECSQYVQYFTKGEEDCLYYNVYTPTLNQTANLDVLIFIHGGAFMLGEGHTWISDGILDKPLVYVNFNYRVGPLGFVSTEDDVLPGNLGLKDQQQALKWIKQNIHYFGGNPNSITLQGLSAGGACVHFHYLSPASKGLFHRGIAMSGTALNNWVLMESPLEHAKKLAALVECPTNSSVDLKSCMKTKPVKQILDNVKHFQPFVSSPFSPWAVVVDGSWASDPVLPHHPLELLRTKQIHDVPLIMSFASSEGLYPGSLFLAKDEYLEAIDTKWNEVMPHILMYNFTVDHSIINNVSQTIRQEFLRNDTLDRRSFQKLIQAITGRCFLADIEKALRLHSAASKSNVWSYMFNYRGSTSISNILSGTTDNLGVSHGDDIIYTLSPWAKHLHTNEDKEMSKLLFNMIVSFTIQGAPNISTAWEPVSKNVRDRLNILKINRYDQLVAIQEDHIGQRPFWDSLPFNENERLLQIKLDF